MEQKQGKERFTESVLAIGLTNLLTKYEGLLIDEYMEDDRFCDVADCSKSHISPYVQRKVEELVSKIYPVLKKQLREIPQLIYKEPNYNFDFCHNELTEKLGVCIYSDTEYGMVGDIDLIEDIELWILEDGDVIAVSKITFNRDEQHMEYRSIRGRLSDGDVLPIDSDMLLDELDSIADNADIY